VRYASSEVTKQTLTYYTRMIYRYQTKSPAEQLAEQRRLELHQKGKTTTCEFFGKKRVA
jgi:hypothetical protein